jgi:hypothetical protein
MPMHFIYILLCVVVSGRGVVRQYNECVSLFVCYTDLFILYSVTLKRALIIVLCFNG